MRIIERNVLAKFGYNWINGLEDNDGLVGEGVRKEEEEEGKKVIPKAKLPQWASGR